jgi:hypothetical protein
MGVIPGFATVEFIKRKFDAEEIMGRKTDPILGSTFSVDPETEFSLSVVASASAIPVIRSRLAGSIPSISELVSSFVLPFNRLLDLVLELSMVLPLHLISF